MATATLPPDLVSPTELARRFGLKRSTLMRWALEGRIPSVRPTLRTVLFDANEVMVAMKEMNAEQRA